MKGKERSPVKKRSRALDEGRDRGGSYPSSRKTGPGALSAGSSNGSAQSRRSLHSEKRDTRESDGHISSSRSGGGYEYGAAPGSKSHGVADVAAETSRSGSRSDARPPSNPGSEYKTLKISELGSELNDEEIEDGLFHEFKKFGEVSVKISCENDYRVAFVNFRRPEDARAAKHARGKLVLYDRPLKIETVYLSRRRSRSPVNKEPFPPGHRHVHTQRPASPTGVGYRDYRLQQLALGRLPAPPPPPDLRELGRDREGSLFDARNRIPFSDCAIYREEDLISPEDDERANRTLFLGNLDTSLNENDLRRTFERFGVITGVDIKRTTSRQSHTFGFIKFENLDMAHRAKLSMSGKIVGRNPIKIGYGKAMPTTRLWVGGLGPWVPLAALAREFDRFGTIRTIDYRKGDTWAYIQYESLDAAQAAWAHMRGFPLGGPERRLRVDFADTDHRYQQQFLQPLPIAPFDIVAESFLHRATPEPLRVRDRTPPPLHFRDRELFPGAEWPNPAIRERVRASPFEPLEHLERERRTREPWSLERELQGREPARKRRALEDGRHLDLSPDSTERTVRRRRASPDGSPGGSSRDGGRFSDSERPVRGERASPARERHSSLERGGAERRPKSQSLSDKASLSSTISATGERKRKAGDGSKGSNKRERSESSFKGGQPSKSDGTKLSLAWHGMLLLKNSNFPANMHLLEGDHNVASDLLVDSTSGRQLSELKITQRLRLDQPKLDEVSRRIKVAGPSGYAILLAVPGTTEDASSDSAASTQRPLRNLVSYLNQKKAAGVISLPVGGSRDKDNMGVLHAFPPCDFSQQFLDSSAKALAKSKEDYLVMIVVRGAS
uniref:RNA-binding protein 15 n=1 Tax=Nothobranchius korthausae TaxID=1143690 RepID=A0A1A8H197_9TELE